MVGWGWGGGVVGKGGRVGVKNGSILGRKYPVNLAKGRPPTCLYKDALSVILLEVATKKLTIWLAVFCKKFRYLLRKKRLFVTKKD